jgi:hypothetical protein
MEVQAQVSVTTLPMDSKERVVVPKSGYSNFRNGTVLHHITMGDRMTAGQVFLLLHQTAFGEVAAKGTPLAPLHTNPLHERHIGDVTLRHTSSVFSFRSTGSFEGIQLNAYGVSPDYRTVYRRVMVKQDGTFSIGDLKRKVKELQAIYDEALSESNRIREEVTAEMAQKQALVETIGDIEDTTRHLRYGESYRLAAGVFAKVANLHEEKINLTFNGLSVEEAKVLTTALRQIRKEQG